MIAICIGHSRPGDKGAVSAGGFTEHSFNTDLGNLTRGRLEGAGIQSVVIDSYQGSTYGRAQAWLAKHLKDIGATAAVELHFNAADGKARGFEYLHWHTSTRGKRLAEFFHASHKTHFPAAVSRGVKPLNKSSRGAAFCELPHCPSIILEPFFGDNPDEWDHYFPRLGVLAGTYAAAIRAYLQAS